MLVQPTRLSFTRAGAAASPAHSDPELVALVRAAAAGDPVALGRLVERFDRALRGVARSYGLSSWDADDVVQATWLQHRADARALARAHAALLQGAGAAGG